MDNKCKYINVPIYIEEDIKKLEKLRDKEKLLVMRINDYMEYHNIPKNTLFSLMKHIEEDVDPNQISIFDKESSNNV